MSHDVASFIVGAAPQESDHEIIDHHQPVVAGICYSASENWKLSIRLRQRSIMVRAHAERAGRRAKGKGSVRQQCGSRATIASMPRHNVGDDLSSMAYFKAHWVGIERREAG